MAATETACLRLPTFPCYSRDLTGTSTTVSDDNYDADLVGDIVNRGGSGLIRRVSNDAGLVAKMIKLVPTDASFKREVEIMKSIRGKPNVVDLITSCAVGDIGYIYMKEYERGDLKQLINENRSGLPEAVVKSFVKQIFTALDACHRAGVVHCDVKPENILIDGTESSSTLFLADFGSAMRLPDGDMEYQILCDSSCFKATRPYQSPESFECFISSVKTDSWATGITMYQLMTGDFPPPVRLMASRGDCDPEAILFEPSVWGKLVENLSSKFSGDCCRVLNGLLTVDSATRLTSGEALRLKWFD